MLAGKLNAPTLDQNVIAKLQWPCYASGEIRNSGQVKVYPKTKQDLAVGLCNALYSFYKCASVRLTPDNPFLSKSIKLQKMPPSVGADAWAFLYQVKIKDIVLASINFDAGVWVPEFYVLQTYKLDITLAIKSDPRS